MTNVNYGHGFVWPDGLPSCIMCNRVPNDPIHITPARPNTFYALPQLAYADAAAPNLPQRSHVYTMATRILISQVPCALCGGLLSDSRHPAGVPAGWREQPGITRPGAAIAEPPMLAHEEAITAEVNGKVILLSRGAVVDTEIPQGLSDLMTEKAGQAGAFQWVMGRYVEADRPNRNAALWSTADLEMGQPGVAQGPINWLHEGRHVIGAIAASELVKTDRQAADDMGVGNHIAALGALWPWLYPKETAMVAQASKAGSLWLSMECISKEVACLTPECGKVMEYRQYAMTKDARCGHMNEGQPRRFVDPIFQGAGIIVPPVRPGWAKADLRVVMPQAAGIVERQAAAFEGMGDSDAEGVVAAALLGASV